MKTIKNCTKCKFLNSDCIWDEKNWDEFFIYHCEKRGEEIDDPFSFVCEDFKRYRQKKYVEPNTVCDSCEKCSRCTEKIEITSLNDIMRHFIPGCGAECRNE